MTEIVPFRTWQAVVKGHRASRQADALGELLFAVPFSPPLRLFVEAKCGSGTKGISDVRNALGVRRQA